MKNRMKNDTVFRALQFLFGNINQGTLQMASLQMLAALSDMREGGCALAWGKGHIVLGCKNF